MCGVKEESDVLDCAALVGEEISAGFERAEMRIAKHII
jgi:hypothetical protein